MIIHLGHALPHASSDRTRKRRASNPYPTLPPSGAASEAKHGNASLFGLAPGGVYRAPDVTTGTGALLPHRFTLTSLHSVAARRSTPASGGLFSVALSLGSPPLDVIQHPALRSPDFPPPAKTARRDHLISFILLPISLGHRCGTKWGERQGRQQGGDQTVSASSEAGQSKMRLQCGQDTMPSCFLTSEMSCGRIRR